MDQEKGKLIHVGSIQVKGRGTVYLFLRQAAPSHYIWYQDGGEGQEEKTSVSGSTVTEAIRNARAYWKLDSFRTLNCGFRYTLPERDEHGENALFYQMAASYQSMNGIYFDEDRCHNCVVYFASQEARDLWQNLQTQSRL